MTSDFYFFDQYSHASRIGGVHRCKRDSKDFNQALFHVKIVLSTDDNDHSNNHTKNQTDDILLQKISHQLEKPMLPEILTKELDKILQIFNDKSRPTSSASSRSKSPEQDIQNKEESTNPTSNQPKVSLPDSLIIQLHSTWLDLIKNTDYKYKVWRTKAGEESWRQHVQKKRSGQLNVEKSQEDIIDNKLPIINRRKSSRVSVSSIGNMAHRQSLIINQKSRPSRSFSRASFLSTNNLIQDNLRLLKSLHQVNSENLVESIKNGIHVEFKLSTQNDQTNQNVVLFDVLEPNVNINEDFIVFTQNKCKRLLEEIKQKILETTNDQKKKYSKICRIWFYEDNQYTRNKNNTFNELNRRQKSKFVLSILRHEIPEKYNIDLDIPETKHKCYIELVDGSIQIYYPSGRLAVLRLRSPTSTTLFFDDTDSLMNQFLGLVTSTGNVLLMQPTFHARFITNNQHEYAYLCDGKTGVIEKEFQYNLRNNCQRQSIISIDENNTFENTIQFQINSFMQLEYHNPSNILFAFKCQNEKFEYQLGTNLPKLIDLTTTIVATKRVSIENSIQLWRKKSNVNVTNIQEKQQIQNRKLSDELNHSNPLSIMEELNLLRKRIKHICHSWLKECRTTLGIMDIDVSSLSDLPPETILIQTKQQSDDQTNHRNKNAKQFNERISLNNQLLTEKFEPNIIANVIEQFEPRSVTGRAIKQQIYTKKILPKTLPIIK